MIGLNSNLDMPVAQFKSSAKPSTYGYTPNIEEKKKEDKEKVATAVLSITAKQKKKNAEKGKKDGEEKMDVDTEKKEDKKEKMEVDEDKKEVEEKKKEPEPNFEMLSNPARVMKAQLKVISLEDGECNIVSFTSLLLNNQFPSSLQTDEGSVHRRHRDVEQDRQG